MSVGGGPLGDDFLAVVFELGGGAFLQGVLKKSWRRTWCFCGEVVVECVVNVVR